jgi:Mg-chelatase subunit ChlD
MCVFKPLPALLCILAGCSLTAAQTQNDCAQRTAIVNVLDEHGNGVTGLTRDRFRIIYRKNSIAPSNAYYSSGPRRVVILLDTSGSMSGHETGNRAKWQAARMAAWDLITVLPPGSKISLTTFAAKPEIRAVLSSDRKPSVDWLNSEIARNPESAKGHTALLTAIEAAIAQLQPSEPGDAIYIITDAGENASRTREPQVQNDLRLSGIRLFGLIVSDGGSMRTEEEDRGPDMLWQLARRSGGWIDLLGSVRARPIYDKRMEERISIQVQGIKMRITDFYFLTVQLPEDPQKKEAWKVEVLDEQGSKLNKQLVSYQSEVLPCRLGSSRP